jgi:hypothetical protein
VNEKEEACVYYITRQNKDIVSFCELDSNISDRFCAADYVSVLGFFPERQDLEIVGLLSVKKWLLLQY